VPLYEVPGAELLYDAGLARPAVADQHDLKEIVEAVVGARRRDEVLRAAGGHRAWPRPGPFLAPSWPLPGPFLLAYYPGQWGRWAGATQLFCAIFLLPRDRECQQCLSGASRVKRSLACESDGHFPPPLRPDRRVGLSALKQLRALTSGPSSLCPCNFQLPCRQLIVGFSFLSFS
jgi:hypothetical protein